MRRLLAVAVLSLASLLVGTPAAQADDTTCVGTFTGVADNIIVLSGDECILEGAQVFGNALAHPESGLFIGPGTTIGGDVEVKEGAATSSFQATIGGNYKCDGCFFEDVIESEVGGSVQIVGADDGDFIQSSVVHGNVEIVESTAGAFAFIIQDTTIDGDLLFAKNVGPTAIGSGGALGGNRIGGDLQIYENNVAGAFCPPEPPPEGCPIFENGLFNGNVVDGNMQVYKNRGPSEISGNTIEENLQCKENDPPPASAGNVARQYEGQCPA